jgi:hypothetical protein
MGTLLLLPSGMGFVEPPQAANKTQLETASPTKTFRHIRNPPVIELVPKN